MHLLVETNFLLELVLEQEQVSSCETLLRAAERKTLTLHIPAFSMMEPLFKLGELDKKRRDLQRQVQEELMQAARETVDKQIIDKLRREFATVLVERNVRQQERLLTLSGRIAAIAELIPLTAQVWTLASELVETTDLLLPDAVVSASLLLRVEELAGEQKLFVTRDHKGFRQDDVKALFETRECDVLFNFEHTSQRLRI